MCMKGFFLRLFFLVLSSLALYFNWIEFNSFRIGFFAIVLYYSISASFWKDVVVFSLPLSKAWSWVFGFLIGFYLSAMLAGIPVVLWKYHRPTIAFSLFFAGFLGYILSVIIKRTNTKASRSDFFASFKKSIFGWMFSIFIRRILGKINSYTSLLGHDKRKVVSVQNSVGNKTEYFKWWHLATIIILIPIFVFFLFHSRTGVFILSPWGALSSFVLALFFIITFFSAFLVFSKKPVWIVLSFIIIFSYASHLYLPAVYETGFGGDKWRHLASASWLAEGNIYTPSVWGEERSYSYFGPVKIPEALVAGNKTSYAAQWASTIFLAESFGIDIFWVDLLLVFLLWSFFLPIILFHFGRILLGKKKISDPWRIEDMELNKNSEVYPYTLDESGDRFGLLLAFLPILFYTFQSEGSITIPVSFFHLFFFFILLLWVYYVKEGEKRTFFIALGFSLFFYWGYILNFFLLIGIGFLAFAYRKLFIERKHWDLYREKLGLGRKRILIRDFFMFGLVLVLFSLAIPFLEVFQGLSSYAQGSVSFGSIINAIADAFGALSGLIGIVVPPDFIDQGNFLYNQTQESLSRLPLFSYRTIPFVVSISVWYIVFFSIYKVLRKKLNYKIGLNQDKAGLFIIENRKIFAFLGAIFVSVLISYFISFSFTEGVRILARRLNETIVFFMVLFLGLGIWYFLLLEKKIIFSSIPYRKKILAVSFLLAFAATSTFASGPKLQMVTKYELKAARLIWSEHKKDPEPYCVIGNTWPLLGLEYVSGRRIVAGNFPLYKEYAQPERVKIFEGMSKSPSQNWIDGAFRVTGSSVCYYMTEPKWTSDVVLEKKVKLFGEPRRVGDVLIWRIEKKD